MRDSERTEVLHVRRKIVQDKGCLNTERWVTKALVPILHKCFHQNCNREYKMEFAQPASMTGMVAGYRQRNGKQNNVAILKLSFIYIKKIYIYTGSQWSIFRSGLACSCLFLRKRYFSWMVLHFWKQITADANEEKVAVVQPTENKRAQFCSV